MWLEGDAYRIGDAFLLATPDAYYWLAGAEGIISTARSGRTAIPEIVNVLAQFLNIPHALVAFWLPVILAPLTAIPACMLAVRWRFPAAGLIAGLLAVAAPGYLYRTRLGFLDDDMLLVLFPCMLIAGLVVWLGPMCRETWLGRGADPVCEDPYRLPVVRIFLGGLFLGGWTRTALWYYPKATVLLLVICLIGFVLAMVLGKSGQRIALFSGFVVLFATAMAGGMLLGTIILLTFWVLSVRGRRSFSSALLAWVSLPAALLISHLAVHLWSVWGKSFSWLTRVLERRSGFSGFDPLSIAKGIFVQPDTAESALTIQQRLLGNVSELQFLTPWETMHFLSGHAVFWAAGLVGLLLLIWKRPMALLLVPLAGIGLLSFQLGARYTVFSGMAWGLGLGCAASLVSQTFVRNRHLRWGVILFILALIFWPLVKSSAQAKPDPVIRQQTALALKEIDTLARKDSWVWIYWDLAYAAQYYSRRNVYAARGSAKQSLLISRPYAMNSPVNAKKHMLRKVKNKNVYLVIDFFMLSKIETILKAGTWDRKKKISRKTGKSTMLDGAFPVNMFTGVLVDHDGHTVELKSMDVLELGFVNSYNWPRKEGSHLVLNTIENRAVIMDSALYETMIVQLFIDQFDRFSETFELVVDYLPAVKVFRVTR